MTESTKAKAANAERQRRYRERALRDPDGLLFTRLQVLIGPYAAGCLDRLARHTGKPKRAIVERAIEELAQRLGVDGAP